eukprot:CAMPEP_0172457454 /NCGR_PEP_ID=MMETSP1065-20121228/22407_1 /TAXON_ID=265537 /ORGANISM="Amphiprora paludosa, Strain CCMP125" /LENGTH=251 /DNA_ID=CAMNT_0013211207 /DNA_START=206 /DNA_END=961 /DNA_ORIENTATION=-
MAFSANAAVRRIARPAAFLHYSTRTTAATRPFTTSPPSSVVDGLSTALFGAETEVDPGKVAGTDLRIVKYPHPSLRRHNQEYTVEELKDKETQKEVARLAKEMFLIMYAAQGVGLAAPQVGVNKRLLVYNQSGDPKKWLDEVVLINPHIVETSQAKTIETEGCLSFPEMDGLVERSKWIKVEALNLKGKKIKKKFVDWEARIFQHEYDHLDGKVYVDRLTTAEELAKVQPRLDELIEEYKADDALTEEPAL